MLRRPSVVQLAIPFVVPLWERKGGLLPPTPPHGARGRLINHEALGGLLRTPVS
jgi:hypothetical protein